MGAELRHLANFHAVEGRTDFPDTIDLTVGYDTPARFANSAKLQPRAAAAFLRRVGGIETTRPPLPRLKGDMGEGTGSAAGSLALPPRRPFEASAATSGSKRSVMGEAEADCRGG